MAAHRLPGPLGRHGVHDHDIQDGTMVRRRSPSPGPTGGHRTIAEGKIAYTLSKNQFGDTLPVIPEDSKVEHGSVLFRVDLDLLVTRNGSPCVHQQIRFHVSGKYSHARMLAPTNTKGKAVLRLETRYSGDNVITPSTPGFGNNAYTVSIGEAWYEATFLITAYNCCDEDDFSGALVEAPNVGSHKTDFLFGGKGVVMQGTGLGSNNRYIAISNPKDLSWKPHYAGVANPDDAVFEYTDGVHGAYGLVTADASIAIDPHILPRRHRVNIIGPRALGERRGDDTGGAIKGHHFDCYVGAGESAVQAWEDAGGNIEDATVKYLGK